MTKKKKKDQLPSFKELEGFLSSLGIDEIICVDPEGKELDSDMSEYFFEKKKVKKDDK